MTTVRWYEVDRARLVLEYVLMRQNFPGFILQLTDGELAWEGEIIETPRGIAVPPLRVRLRYPPAYPVRAPWVSPLAPELPQEHWGHRWHRWQEGYVCIVQPKHWEPSYTAVDAIAKAADWYFNYTAYTHNLIANMPDVGRAMISNSGDIIE